MIKLLLGCGYLGRRVATAWHAAGDEVHVVTRSRDRVAEFSRRGWTGHVADVCDPASLAQLPACDTVLFCVGFDRGSGHSREAVMVDGLTNVLNQIGERCQRFIYTSSTSVYGQQTGEWVDESSPCEPTEDGGKCCLAAEKLVWQSFPREQGDRGGVVLRLAGLYGPGRLLSRIDALQRGEPIPGRVDAWLNVLHVDDAASTIRACEDRWQPGETFLVCDDRPIPRGEYFAQLAQLVHVPPPPFDDALPARRGAGGLNKRCSNRKLHERLGLTLRYPTIREGLPAALIANDE